CMQARQTPYSF
nr:immunoglobulin light chain junction region [Macaca mulatta]MPN89894.1 immunoglobulin light chain junction region [Macaca mulatta]